MTPQDMTGEEEVAYFRGLPTDTFTWRVERVTVQPGRTFSAAAMDALVSSMTAFVGARVMARWDATREPPTALVVTVTVDAK